MLNSTKSKKNLDFKKVLAIEVPLFIGNRFLQKHLDSILAIWNAGSRRTVTAFVIVGTAMETKVLSEVVEKIPKLAV